MCDVWSVVDYLSTLDYVDSNELAIVGICTGGGCATAATKPDHRLKALAIISMVTIGNSARLGWTGDEDPSEHVKTTKQVAQQITAEVI